MHHDDVNPACRRLRVVAGSATGAKHDGVAAVAGATDPGIIVLGDAVNRNAEFPRSVPVHRLTPRGNREMRMISSGMSLPS
jgi:hypothetical protein